MVDVVVPLMKQGTTLVGRPSGRRKAVAFHDSIQLPTDWDLLEELDKCARRTAYFDKKPL